ncbi:alpha/beta hydrolase [Myxococcota bacterium]|nr:alpha/beta hydrolase [Myxococcota bacterium]
MQHFGVLTRYLVLPVLFVMIFGTAVVLSTRAYLQRQTLQTTTFRDPQSIDTLEAVKLGGWEQSLLIRGKDRRAPILLWLHDGPGGASDLVFSRAFEQSLVQRFVVVHWEQRGTGKSYRDDLPAHTMTLPRLRSDLVELVAWLRHRFQQPKIYLLGYAWGSTLGLWFAQQHPDQLHAYIGVSQILDWQQHLREAYAETLRRAKQTDRAEPINALTQIGPPPYSSLLSLHTLRRWVAEFGGYFHKAPSFGKMFRASLSSPDYSLADLFQSNKAYQFSSQHLLLPAIQQTNLRSIRHLHAPALFLSGRYDLLTSGQQLERFVQQLQAPHKQLLWFEDAGYAPHREDPDRFYKALLDLLPPFAKTPQPNTRPLSPPSSLPSFRPASSPSFRPASSPSSRP